ncbi:hypothetical protein A3753_32495 [Sulfitobacter sp. HI0082]|nr:hypothetical protein A3753_32495 [Sulfitobacter sp. HI0082]
MVLVLASNRSFSLFRRIVVSHTRLLRLALVRSLKKTCLFLKMVEPNAPHPCVKSLLRKLQLSEAHLLLSR